MKASARWYYGLDLSEWCSGINIAAQECKNRDVLFNTACSRARRGVEWNMKTLKREKYCHESTIAPSTLPKYCQNFF